KQAVTSSKLERRASSTWPAGAGGGGERATPRPGRRGRGAMGVLATDPHPAAVNPPDFFIKTGQGNGCGKRHLPHPPPKVAAHVQATKSKSGPERSHPPLFRQVAVEAALGTQVGEAFAAHWRGVKVLTAVAFALTVTLFLFMVTVHYSPAYRVPCYTDVQSGL